MSKHVGRCKHQGGYSHMQNALTDIHGDAAYIYINMNHQHKQTHVHIKARECRHSFVIQGGARSCKPRQPSQAIPTLRSKLERSEVMRLVNDANNAKYLNAAGWSACDTFRNPYTFATVGHSSHSHCMCVTLRSSVRASHTCY